VIILKIVFETYVINTIARGTAMISRFERIYFPAKP
jgi:hypothetical protein